MTITYHTNFVQGSDQWIASRLGLLTASEMDRIITINRIIADEEHKNNPNKKVDKKKRPKNEEEKEMTHLYELAAQRITQYVEPHYIGDDMLRGQEDESYARETYDEHYGAVTECGFVTNDEWGFTLGYSPDWLVGEEGQGEAKSRRQKYQLETIVKKQVPEDYVIQNQTGLLVTRRKWCDFVSYCGGMKMITIRVEPDQKVQDAIEGAATAFNEKMKKLLKEYADVIADPAMKLIQTERKTEQEITL